MIDDTLITRIMGISKSAIADVKLNYSHRQLNYFKSPEGGMMVTGDSSTLEEILAWLENNHQMHSVRRVGSQCFCEHLLLALREGKFLTYHA
jgi:hypothetical protein